jgi:hypothetical protein
MANRRVASGRWVVQEDNRVSASEENYQTAHAIVAWGVVIVVREFVRRFWLAVEWIKAIEQAWNLAHSPNGLVRRMLAKDCREIQLPDLHREQHAIIIETT